MSYYIRCKMNNTYYYLHEGGWVDLKKPEKKPYMRLVWKKSCPEEGGEDAAKVAGFSKEEDAAKVAHNIIKAHSNPEKMYIHTSDQK